MPLAIAYEIYKIMKANFRNPKRKFTPFHLLLVFYGMVILIGLISRLSFD